MKKSEISSREEQAELFLLDEGTDGKHTLYPRNVFHAVKTATQTFSQNPLEGIALYIPVLITAIGLVATISTTMRFGLNGGYRLQIASMRSGNFWDGIASAFTKADTGALQVGMWRYVFSILFVLALLLTSILFFKYCGKGKKIAACILLSVSLISGTFYWLFNAINRKEIKLSAENTLKFIRLFKQYSTEQIGIFKLTLVAVSVVALLVFGILIAATKETRLLVGYNSAAFACIYLLYPLIILLVENIVPMVCAIIFCGLVIGITIILFRIFTSGENGSDDSKNEQACEKMPIPHKASTSELPKNSHNEYLLKNGVQVRKVHGSMHDYVETYTSLAFSEVCSLHDLRTGKFKIYDKSGRQMNEHDMPWK